MDKSITTTLVVAKLFTEQEVIEQAQITFTDTIESFEQSSTGIDQVNSNQYADCWLIPGLIDTHAHGAMGFDVMDASHQSLDAISQYFASTGVVGFLATTMTAEAEEIYAALKQIHRSKEAGVSGAEILGGYLEGPFFNAQYKGAQPAKHFLQIDKAQVDKFIAAAQGSLSSIALAPEQPQALSLIPYLKECGLRVMLGHSSATYQQTMDALNAGADGVVHCFNGMRGLHHREPGLPGAALSCPHCYTELIADGEHVHPAVIKLCYQLKGSDYLNLITDSVPSSGLADGEYLLGTVPITMKAGIVRTSQGGLAGSSLKLIDAVRDICQWADIDLHTAIKMASLTPATMLGIEKQCGSICVGKQASFTLINKDFEVQATWVQGKQVYQRQPD